MLRKGVDISNDIKKHTSKSRETSIPLNTVNENIKIYYFQGAG
jgi:hypothetical protein